MCRDFQPADHVFDPTGIIAIQLGARPERHPVGCDALPLLIGGHSGYGGGPGEHAGCDWAADGFRKMQWIPLTL